MVHKEYGKELPGLPDSAPLTVLSSMFLSEVRLPKLHHFGQCRGAGDHFSLSFLALASTVLCSGTQFGFVCKRNALQKGGFILLPVGRLYLEAVRKQSLQVFTGERHCQSSLRHGTKYVYLGSRLTSSKYEPSGVVRTGFPRTPGQISWSADLSITPEKIRLSGNERATLDLD